MAEKKRRTELDIEPIAPEPEPEAEAPPPAPAEEEAPHKPTPGKKVNKVKLLIVIGAALGGLLILGGITWGVVSWLTPPPVVEEEKPKEKPKVKKPKPKTKLPKVSAPVAVIPPIKEFEPFLMSLGKPGEKTLIKLSIAAELSGPNVTAEIDRNLVLIRENIFLFLQTQKTGNFTDPKKKRKMQIDIAIILNRSIQAGAITRVLFTELLIDAT